MDPWMIVAMVVAAGFVVLLIAPTIHRRINAKSRREAESKRVNRAQTLRSSSSGAVLVVEKAADAARLRDLLLLNGVRAELISEKGQSALVYNVEDHDTVTKVKAELDIA